MAHSNLNAGKVTHRGVYGLALLTLLSSTEGLAAQKESKAAPPPQTAPAKPIAKPVVIQGRPGASQPDNTRPAPNGITMDQHAGPSQPGNMHPEPNSVTMQHPVDPRKLVPTNRPPGTTTGMLPVQPPGRQPPVRPPIPEPPTGRPTVLPNGGIYTKKPDGSTRMVFADKGMVIEHPRVSGPPRVVVNHPDRQIVSQGDGGYVHRNFTFHNQQFARRTIYEHGRTYDRFYARYSFHGVYLDSYRPSHYYGEGFYHWAGRPWGAAVQYNWGWRTDPWAGYYGYYFTPVRVYDTPSLWLADYVIASSLQASYAAQTAGPPPAGATPLTPEVQQQIAYEVQRQVQQENTEAQANAHGQAPSGPTGVAALFNDNQPHVFVGGTDLSLQDQNGRQCQFSQGDVLQVHSLPAAAVTSVSATVLTSKGGSDCVAASNVSVSLTDLQDMQNYMREVSDEGLRELQAKQGQNGLPPAPADATAAPVAGAFVNAAPAPDSDAAAAITAQNSDAAQVEQNAGVPGMRQMNLAPSPAPVRSSAAASGASTVTISLGQPIATVRANMGAPDVIQGLGARQVYVYKSLNMKVIFQNGTVADIQ